jgi:putative ATP-binding cassette transporter
MMAIDAIGANEKRIEITETSRDKLVLENLEIATPTGCAKLDQARVEIARGDRVLIVGDSGVGKTILFQAIAGLWSWGTGRIELPSNHGTLFMPRQPYVPLGSLRAALSYPSAEDSYKDEELAPALRSTGLDRLASSLDKIERWDKELSFDEQQLLVFTRVLLHKPHCVVIDEALDILDDEARQCIIDLFNDKLKETAVINIGRLDRDRHFFTRVLHISKEPSGRCFKPDISAHGAPINSSRG